MTDGMMEAYRETKRAEATTRFFCNLIRYLKRPGARQKNVLYACAKETDEVRGGNFIGTTKWVAWLDSNLAVFGIRKRGSADRAWMLLLARVKNDPWKNDVDNGWEVINLFDELKALSPFAADTLVFPDDPRPLIYSATGTRSIGELERAAFKRMRIDPKDDRFAFILRFKGGEPFLDPIWLGQTTFQNGERPRTGPIIKSRK